MIPLLLDMGLPRRAAEDLRARGWDVTHVGDLGLATATDAEILHVANAQRRVVVTLDGDFSALLARSGATGPSVIHIRLQRVDRKAAVELLLRIVDGYATELRGGCIASVGPGPVRLRALPISPA